MQSVPEEAAKGVQAHVIAIEAGLPGLLYAYYIHGSVAMSAFQYWKSDVDFFAVLARELTAEELYVLQGIHARLNHKLPRIILDGMYVQLDGIRNAREDHFTCLRFNEGRFLGVKRFDQNSADAYVLNQYGIRVKGPVFDDFHLHVDLNTLCKRMKFNLNTYWRDWLDARTKFASMKFSTLFFSEEQIAWGVLGVSRIFYSMKERDVISKVGAGDYALKTVPEKWHRVIREALRVREGRGKTYYRSIITRRNDVIGYMNYIIRACNSLV